MGEAANKAKAARRAVVEVTPPAPQRPGNTAVKELDTEFEDGFGEGDEVVIVDPIQYMNQAVSSHAGDVVEDLDDEDEDDIVEDEVEFVDPEPEPVPTVTQTTNFMGGRRLRKQQGVAVRDLGVAVVPRSKTYIVRPVQDVDSVHYGDDLIPYMLQGHRYEVVAHIYDWGVSKHLWVSA